MLQIDSGEDAQEEFGWKLVHGDVFRPPRKGMLLSVLLGSGTQVFCMSLITLGKNLHVASETSGGNDGDTKSTSSAKIIVYSDLHLAKHYDYVRAYSRILIEKLVTAALVSEFFSPYRTYLLLLFS
jgi:transmembrane 9 superfamily protein 2/4